METWKALSNFANGEYKSYYEVSNLGRVRSVDRVVSISERQQNHVAGRVISQHLDKYGYKEVFLWKNGKAKSAKVHRLVALEFLTDCKYYGLEVNHKDENKSNNNLLNLEWCNHVYNNRYGTKNDRAKFTKLDMKVVIAYNIHSKIEYWLLGLKQASKFLDTPVRLVFEGIKNRNQVKGYVLAYLDKDYKSIIRYKIERLNKQLTTPKPVRIISSSNKEYIVKNAREAVSLTGVSRSQVSMLLNGRKQMVKGYQMSYIPYQYDVQLVYKDYYNGLYNKLANTHKIYQDK